MDEQLPQFVGDCVLPWLLFVLFRSPDDSLDLFTLFVQIVVVYSLVGREGAVVVSLSMFGLRKVLFGWGLPET
jgi:hypothetical protein